MIVIIELGSILTDLDKQKRGGMMRIESEGVLTNSASIPKKTTFLKKLVDREIWTGYLFLFPSFSLFIVFLFYPLIKSIYLSFQLTDPQGRVVEFVGLENYIQLWTNPYFLQTLKVTGLFILYTVPTTILLALPVAYLSHQAIRGKRLFQFVFSLPLSVSVATGSVIWALLFNPTMGMLNAILGYFHIPPVFWLSDPNMALFSVALMTVWLNFGFAFIIILGGLQTVPEELFESARIDGAGMWRSFYHVALPLITPNLFFLLVISLIGALQTFGQIHLLTQGGPMNATNVLVYNMYLEAFRDYRFGTGSAQALFLFFVVLIVTLLQFRFLEKKVHYQ